MRGFRFRSSLAEVNEFFKNTVIQDKSKPMRIAMMIWLRVKVNGTRLCMAVYFARNKIKYQKKSRKTNFSGTNFMHVR